MFYAKTSAKHFCNCLEHAVIDFRGDLNPYPDPLFLDTFQESS